MIYKCCKKDCKNFSEAEIFTRALADKHRIRILCILKEEKKCVSELMESLCLAQNLVSFHLKNLCDVGIIKGEREGHKIYYSRNEDRILECGKFLMEQLLKEPKF